MFSGELFFVVIRSRSRSIPCRVKVADKKVNDYQAHKLSLRIDDDVIVSGGTDVIMTVGLDDHAPRRCRAGTVSGVERRGVWRGKIVLGHFNDPEQSNITWYLVPNGLLGCIQVSVTVFDTVFIYFKLNINTSFL